MRTLSLIAVLGLALVPAFSHQAVQPPTPAPAIPTLKVQISQQELEQAECRLLAKAAFLASAMRQHKVSTADAKIKLTEGLDPRTVRRTNRMVDLAYASVLDPRELENRLIMACENGMAEFLLQAMRSNESCAPVVTFATFAYEKREKKNPKARVKRFLIRNLELSSHRDLVNRLVDEVYASKLGKEETVENIRSRCSASFFVASLPTGD